MEAREDEGDEMRCFCLKMKKNGNEKHELPVPTEICKLILSFLEVRDLRIVSLVGNHRRHRNSLASHAKRQYNKRFSKDSAAHFIVCLNPLQRWPTCVQIRRNIKDSAAIRDFRTDYTCHHIEDIPPGQTIGHIKAKLLNSHEHVSKPCKHNIPYKNQLVYEEGGIERIDEAITRIGPSYSDISEPCFTCHRKEHQDKLVVVHMDGILKQHDIQSFLRAQYTMYSTLINNEQHSSYKMTLARLNTFFTEEFANLFVHMSGGNKQWFVSGTRSVIPRLTSMANNNIFHAVLLCPKCAFFRLSPNDQSISHRASYFFFAWQIIPQEGTNPIIGVANEIMKRRGTDNSGDNRA